MVKGLSKTKILINTNSMVITRGKGVREVGEGKGGGNDDRGLRLGDKHIIQYTDDVL